MGREIQDGLQEVDHRCFMTDFLFQWKRRRKSFPEFSKLVTVTTNRQSMPVLRALFPHNAWINCLQLKRHQMPEQKSLENWVSLFMKKGAFLLEWMSCLWQYYMAQIFPKTVILFFNEKSFYICIETPSQIIGVNLHPFL